ncbi:hypothetical protein [Pedobacter sp. G11]|nr:hypothetical protein [Pedobacter sp. G11]
MKNQQRIIKRTVFVFKGKFQVANNETIPTDPTTITITVGTRAVAR